MRRSVWGWIAWGAFLFQGGFAVAQNSLETLEQELQEAKQQHDEVSSKALANFFSQVDAAMASPDAAVALYVQARSAQLDFIPPVTDQNNDSALANLLLSCGIPLTPVITEHENETTTEKEARLAIDQANLARLGATLQLHCGLMHFAVLFVTKPDQKGLQDDWVAWLKTAAALYPQLSVPVDTSNQPPPQHKKKRAREDGSAESPPGPPKPPPPFNPSEIKGKSMRDSIIGKFLGFKSWDVKDLSVRAASGSSPDSKEPGEWSVKDMPKFYRTNVLDPLRASPTAATLAAWDVYISMANADETDNDRWNQVVYPALQFERACDDYTIAPGTEKLEGLMNLIKANPTYPQVDDWIVRVKKMLDDYSASHGGKVTATQNPATTPPAPTDNPNVIVTTSTQGDMTIVTTHTNSAPVTNAPPTH
jgi:hypothetical protein